MQRFLFSIKNFIKKETVFVISFLVALVSCFFVRPDKDYINYIDFRTLALLYCLMVVVSGLSKANFFERLASSLCKRAKSVRGLGAYLVLLCFFSSMLITNDVALLTFVPFSVLVLTLAGATSLLIPVVVLQTIAANLGSMLTPVGNPQNLYLYSYFNYSFIDFIKVTAPIWLISLALVMLLTLRLPKNDFNANVNAENDFNKKYFIIHLVMFIICLLSVLHILEWYIMLAILVVTLLIFDRKTLLKCDFMLLLTFVCFFVFSGNLARIEAVSSFLHSIMASREYFVSLLSSQVISNVPAAVLLSGFSENSRALILGVDVGGLGTPVASLASLISYKLYMKSENAKSGKYMLEFLIYNFILLIVLSIVSVVIMG